MTERVRKIEAVEVVVNAEENLTQTADMIVTNAEGSWYAVDLGDGWDYLQDNGEYIPA